MRADGKAEGLRQSMSWLHTWSGLLLGWLLYAVFFTGTLSYFVDEIDDGLLQTGAGRVADSRQRNPCAVDRASGG